MKGHNQHHCILLTCMNLLKRVYLDVYNVGGGVQCNQQEGLNDLIYNHLFYHKIMGMFDNVNLSTTLINVRV
jgi:hypothetical protein